MPTYEYKCTNGHTFEAFQSITEAPLTKCPKCKAGVRRVINGGMGVIFKGSGFYTTDYKKSSALTGSNSRKSDGNGSDSKSPSPADGSKDKGSDKGSTEKGSSEKASKEKGSKEKAAAS